MKVLCINKGAYYNSLVVGQWYDTITTVEHNGIGHYQIMNEYGFILGYETYLFKTIDDIRNERINDILK